MQEWTETPFERGHTLFGCARVAPEGRAQDHWRSATLEEFSQQSDQDTEFMDEEKVLAGRPDANIPAMLTKDVRGG